MTVPLIILSVFAIFAGFVGAPFMHNGYASYVFYGEPHHPEANYFVMLLSTVLALAGIGLAYLMYHKKSIDPAKIAKSSGPIYGILSNRFYIDQIYQWIFDVIVMGFDCNKWALEELLAGNWNYDGQCNPFQASYIDAIIKDLQAGKAPAEKTIIMDEKGFDASTITQEDVDNYGI